MSKSKNSNLHAAKVAKNDEFYTQLTDIEKELKYYKDQFKDKVVYCNCDNPQKSEFVRFFRLKFVDWGLKKLIATCITEDNSCGWGYVWDKDINGNGILDEDEVTMVPLQQNGDFRSPECVAYLQEADIVVSNPPFSCYRLYIKQLMDYNKKFLVIGNKNAFTYKEIFPYIKDGKLRTGKNWVKEFNMPDGGKKKFGNICWFTNLETHKADDPMLIYMKYTGNEDKFPYYDNYRAIDCSKIADFPIDLPIGAVVGVPITIVDRIADDGFIYFDDGGVSGEKIGYGIEKFRKGDDGKDLGYAITTNGGGKQEIHTILPNPYQAYQVIDARVVAKNMSQQKKGTMLIKDKDSAINGKATYARVAIKRIK